MSVPRQSPCSHRVASFTERPSLASFTERPSLAPVERPPASALAFEIRRQLRQQPLRRSPLHRSPSSPGSMRDKSRLSLLESRNGSIQQTYKKPVLPGSFATALDQPDQNQTGPRPLQLHQGQPVQAQIQPHKSVLKTDVEAALQVLNFAIYHKELTDMEEREHEMKQKADHDADHNNGNLDGGSTLEPMVIDVDHASDQDDLITDRIQAFETILGQHVLANHLDQISVAEIEQIVNREAATPYTRRQISSILERMQDSNRIMIAGDIVRII